jgi:hypothetical protein
MRNARHGGLTPPALGRECERYGNRAYSSCKFDRNVAAFGNAPSTHAYLSADSIRSPRLAHAIRSWLRMRTLLQMCDSGRRERHFSTGGLRPPLLVAQCRAGAPNAEAVTKNSGHAGPWNPSLADWGMDPLTASRVVRLLPRLWNRNLVDWGMERPTASRVVRLLPRLWNRNLVDWGMDPLTASRVVRLLTRLWNRSLVDWGMEPPTADRGVRLLPRLWNPSVTDRTMDRGAVQDLFTADRCGLLSRAACTVNPGGRAKKARMRAIANCQWHSGSRQPRCYSEKRFHTGPGIWKE